MVVIRSANEIILSLIDYLKLAQPDADTKPGTVIRDLFIEAPASQLALLYDELATISNKQSFRLVIGNDLDLLAKNFGMVRKQSTFAAGIALYTFYNINSTIVINSGDIAVARNGISFSVNTTTVVTPNAINNYLATATKYNNQLSLIGINDKYAVEIPVTATSAGSVGNISAYSLSTSNSYNVSNITNINAFNGGTDQENDADFRNRVLSAFSGSSIGTSLGYLNTTLATTGVTDAYVVEPGDPLMIRDGTQVITNNDGSLTVISEGSGGKVDVIFLGNNLTQNIDSFIYQDKSNNNDPTNSNNDFILGQILTDAGKTINRKRIDNISSGILPAQPASSILSVSGSISGNNFISKTVDEYGRISGNYELIKDNGIYSGSPWGFDTFHWISNKISLLQEDKIKGQYNAQDTTSYPDVLAIPQVQQSIAITNENSQVTYDRSIIQLLHTPSNSATRVYNVNTGERYNITNQNYDSTGTYNTTGRIQITGNTLPSPSDVLQVDYNWLINYDRYSDYDGLQYTTNSRQVNDSIDWGYSSVINNENIWFTNNNNFFTGTASHPIDTIISAKQFTEIDGIVTKITSGIYINRLCVILNNLSIQTSTVESVTLKNNNTELYSTAQNDGVIINNNTIVGINSLYNSTIILPTDTVAILGNKTTAIFNSTEVFSSSSKIINGSSSGYQITIPSSLIITTATSIILRVSYIASITDLFSSAISSLPASKIGNGYTLSSNIGFNNFSPANISKRENQIVQQNLSNQYFIELNTSSLEYSLIPSQVISVIRLSDGKELWNVNNLGTITIGTDNNFQIIFTGYNSPNIADNVLIIYYIVDNFRFQPFSYSNTIIKSRTDTLKQDPTSSQLYISLNNITTEPLGLTFSILDTNTNINYLTHSLSDGYIYINNAGNIMFCSIYTIFNNLPDILNKKLLISNAQNPNNNGLYDIISIDIANNSLHISNILDNITVDQISIIRVLDGKEIWNYSGMIDISNNQILMPKNVFANVNDNVYVILYNFSNLRKSPTKIINTISDQIVNSGVLTIKGTTIYKAQDVIFTSINNGLKLNISEAIMEALNLNSTSTVPNNVNIAKIIKLEKVATSSNVVTESLIVYDTKNTIIQNNLLYTDSMLSDYTLPNLEFILPSTKNNNANLPAIGDSLRISFYYTLSDDSENLSYTKNGSLYTNKKFAYINKIYVSSGLNSSQSAKITSTSFTQPTTGTRYQIFYDYLAPKQNERIIINYDYNQLCTSVTFNLETSRPINADILAKAAQQVLLDLTMNIVISNNYLTSKDTIVQSVKDQLISSMTVTKLGSVIDTTTLINIAQSITGVARARIIYFNVTGTEGSISIFQALNNQYFSANNIIVNTEIR